MSLDVLEIEFVCFKEMADRGKKSTELEDPPPVPSKAMMSIQYFSGNPSIETTRGILHLYKDKYDLSF